MVLWSVASFDYYLISFFMKYIPGSIFVNATVSTVAEIVANMSSGFFYNFFGPKKAFVICFTISATGGFLITLMPNASPLLTAFFVLVAKFGISFAFTMVYLITP